MPARRAPVVPALLLFLLLAGWLPAQSPAPARVFGQMDNFYTNAEDVAGMVSALGLHLPARIAVEIIRIMTL